MPRSQLVVKKMGGKRKRSTKWGLVPRKKYTLRNTRSYVPRIFGSDFGFPDKLVTKVRYCDVYTLTGTVGLPGIQSMRMNSLQDPDFTGSGHQPMWVDQLLGSTGSGPYNKYRVLGSKITVTFAVSSAPSLAALNNSPVLVGILTQYNNGVLPTTSSGLMETDNCKWTVISDKSGGDTVKTVVATYSPKRDLSADEGDDTIAASAGSNPAAQFYAHMFKVDDTGGATVKAYCQVEYLVEFFNRNEVTQS